MDRAPALDDDALLAGFASARLRRHPELLDQKTGLLSRYYDVESVARSVRAKQIFLLPQPDPAGRGT